MIVKIFCLGSEAALQEIETEEWARKWETIAKIVL